jgi:gas vesicle protein
MTIERQGMGLGSFLGAFVLGAAAGATVALLTAPRAGRETRERLKGASFDLRETAERVPAALRKAGTRAIKAGQEAFAEAREEVTHGSSDHS